MKKNKDFHKKIRINHIQEYSVNEIKKTINRIENKIKHNKTLKKNKPDEETLDFWNTMHDFSFINNELEKEKKKYEAILNGSNSN